MQGGAAGLFSALIMTLWVGMGAIIEDAYKPVLPTRTDGCYELNGTTESPFFTGTDSLLTSDSTLHLERPP